MCSVLAMAAILFSSRPVSALDNAADPAPLRDAARITTYRVAPGDTLIGIADGFGITSDTILWANGLSSKDFLKVGQELTILPVSGVLHRVRAGESVLSIASLYGVDGHQIVEANHLSDASMVQEGALLTIPGGVQKVAAPAPKPAAEDSETGSTYTVKAGDTLSSIAANFGVKTSTLQAANGLADEDFLKVGQQLAIPGGGQLAEQAAEPAQEPVHEAAEDREASNRGDHQRDGKSFIATLTAYSIQGRTSSGNPTRWGVIAVDPSVIPLGSKVRIDGFEDLFVAEDTGGGIRNDWIDIWFPNFGDALRFGIQSRRVTIVEP